MAMWRLLQLRSSETGPSSEGVGLAPAPPEPHSACALAGCHAAANGGHSCVA